MKKSIVICLLLGLLCTGCGYHAPITTIPTHRVVVGIDITFQNGPLYARRIYTNSEKMSAILHYLRFIDPYGTPPEPPESVDGSDFYIVLSYSDGGQKLYRQHADRYMQVDGGDWKSINVEKAMELSRILGKMQSDEI